MEAPNNNDICIIQVPIYIHSACIVQVLIYISLLTITHLHDKAAVVTKTLVKSICLGVQLE